MPEGYKQFRCPYCDKRLFDYKDGEKFTFNAKCPRCKVLIRVTKI